MPAQELSSAQAFDGGVIESFARCRTPWLWPVRRWWRMTHWCVEESGSMLLGLRVRVRATGEWGAWRLHVLRTYALRMHASPIAAPGQPHAGAAEQGMVQLDLQAGLARGAGRPDIARALAWLAGV